MLKDAPKSSTLSVRIPWALKERIKALKKDAREKGKLFELTDVVIIAINKEVEACERKLAGISSIEQSTGVPPAPQVRVPKE